MNIFDKIDFLKKEKQKAYKNWEKYQQEPYNIDVRDENYAWPAKEINELLSLYPNLPQVYINFIKHYNCLGISWAVFFGSTKSRLPLSEELEYWKNNRRDHYFPAAKDADGSVFALNKDNAIVLFDKYDLDWEKPQYIARSLELFINDCLLGSRYKEFLKECEFLNFLKLQGWA